MGDDLLDLPVLGASASRPRRPTRAEDVRTRVHWVSRYAGGRGAVREFVELMLGARGRWDALVHALSRHK